MIFLVESVDVRPDDVDAYVAGFETHYLPGALERGMELVGCWHTPKDIGEDVTVTVDLRTSGLGRVGADPERRRRRPGSGGMGRAAARPHGPRHEEVLRAGRAHDDRFRPFRLRPSLLGQRRRDVPVAHGDRHAEQLLERRAAQLRAPLPVGIAQVHVAPDRPWRDHDRSRAAASACTPARDGFALPNPTCNALVGTPSARKGLRATTARSCAPVRTTTSMSRSEIRAQCSLDCRRSGVPPRPWCRRARCRTAGRSRPRRNPRRRATPARRPSSRGGVARR